jgi:two-component system sensor histidine kinase PhoQ
LFRWRPRSLQSRQLWAASIGLVAFLALAGYALDRAFVDVASQGQRERLKSFALYYAGQTDFARDGSLIPPDVPPEGRFDRPGSGLYASINLPDGAWASLSAQGPVLPEGEILPGSQERFEGPLPMTRSDGTPGEVYRYSLGLVDATRGDAAEFPYTINIMEDAGTLPRQVTVFRQALWGYLGIAAIVLLFLQALILRWSLLPLRRVEVELKRVQRGQLARMSGHHPRELEPLTESINALVDSERENLERQRNTLADLAHSLKTPLAVLRNALAEPAQLPAAVSQQVSRMDQIVQHQLTRAGASGAARFAPYLALAPVLHRIRESLGKVNADKDLAIDLDCAPDLRWRIDEGDAFELLGNLLDNAAKWAKQRIDVKVWRDGDGLRIRIEDDGPGFSDTEAILQLHVRADEQVPGHGVGLAVVNDLVASHEGELKLSRGALGGAQVEILLPAA